MMRNIWKRISIGLLVVIVLLTNSVNLFAFSETALNNTIKETAATIYKTVKVPQVGSIGGEWAVLGLARSDYEVPKSYYEKYYVQVETYVKDCKGQLHEKKYTEYSRVIVALTAIGKNPQNVAGYNLLTPLGDYEKTIWQGLNGPIWALIALDSGNYEMPVNHMAKVQATRQMYIEKILQSQLSDGGFSLTGSGESEPDLTAMALASLAKYQNQKVVKQAIDKGVACLSNMQNEEAGYASYESKNSESVAQVIVALCELGISLEDERFIKNGNTLLDNLMTYYIADGGFKHTLEGSGSNQMATEQAFYALVAAKRVREGKNSLYRMQDVIKETAPIKKEEVLGMPVVLPGKTFSDIVNSPYQGAIEGLVQREIIKGKNETAFEPEHTITRAEFAAIIVKALGLDTKKGSTFSDVKSLDWFYEAVSTASYYGLVSGVSETAFNPKGTITREEAAVMVARAALLCGMDNDQTTTAVRDTLAGFIDYPKTAKWAQNAVAFCYSEGIWNDEALEIQPKREITRGEVAQMVWELLNKAKLV